MKKLYLIIALIATTVILAQAPQGFNYQATVRNNSGQLVLNQNVLVKFNIYQNSATGTLVYSENQSATTDDLGHINLVVGQGTATTATFSTINWGSGSYYLGIELNSGNGYLTMGTTQLLSVPYALYANSAGNNQAATPNLASVLAVNNGANNLQIKNLADPTDPQDAVTKSYLATQIAQLQAQITALQNASIAPLPNVTIGTQVWSTNNLEVTTYRDGTPIPQVTDPAAWANLTTGAWCYYNHISANGVTYGKLYNWYAVAGIHDNDPNTPNKILAPSGWRIPTYGEWTTLINYLDPAANGGQSFPNVAGGKMKETGTLRWVSPNTGANNQSGFSGLPGGAFGGNTTFYGIGTNGNWWSLSELNTVNAWYVYINYDNTNAASNLASKTLGFSVRCIRN
jgi:uncharacterized protein (TIGR02145 family)